MSYASRCGIAILCFSLVKPVLAQQPQNFPSAIRPLALLTTEAMQKELELTEDQQAKIAPLHKQYMEVVAKNHTEMGEDSALRSVERYKALMKINDELEPKVKEILTPKQFERAQQIAYQYRSFRVFRSPEIIKALGLTDDQTQKIEAAYLEFQKQQFRLLRDTPDSPERAAVLKKTQEEGFAEVIKVLTKEQNEKWMAIRGKPFDISTLRLPNQPKADEKKTE